MQLLQLHVGVWVLPQLHNNIRNGLRLCPFHGEGWCALGQRGYEWHIQHDALPVLLSVAELLGYNMLSAYHILSQNVPLCPEFAKGLTNS